MLDDVFITLFCALTATRARVRPTNLGDNLWIQLVTLGFDRKYRSAARIQFRIRLSALCQDEGEKVALHRKEVGAKILHV